MKWNTEINLDQHNVWFTSDLHLYHSNILWMNNRPFANCDEMWEKIKEDWNSKVKPDDYVFILGDVLWGSQTSRLKSMRESLNGHICIVLGNHDKEKYGECELKEKLVNFIKKYGDGKEPSRRLLYEVQSANMGSNFTDIFDSCERSELIRVKSAKLGVDQLIFMSHYPADSWPQKGRGSIHLHGHVHGSMDEVNESRPDLRVDVGIDGKLANMHLLSFDDIYTYFLHKAGDIPLYEYMRRIYEKKDENGVII